jgi:predicted DCC family thiol-disulfide oxidoreductase YuxK
LIEGEIPLFRKIQMLRQANLPDPDTLNDADLVIYDGQCNFCSSSVASLRRLDCCGNRLSFISLHDPRVAERYDDLSHQQLMEQMYVVDRSDRRHGGAEAVRYLSRRLPLLWIVAPILHIPGSARLWQWLYRQVARRRYAIAGKSCENDVCKIHLDQRIDSSSDAERAP